MSSLGGAPFLRMCVCEPSTMHMLLGMRVNNVLKGGAGTYAATARSSLSDALSFPHDGLSGEFH